MPKREPFVSEKIYHICNRGADKRSIFLDDADYLRAIHNLFEFNDQNPILNNGYFFAKNKSIVSGSQYIRARGVERKLLVEILAFCLMPNHFHLLLRQKTEGGLTVFMNRFSMGYAKYFNKKYERSGVLFQGRFKSVLVNNEAHFLHLPFYIHSNPLDLIGSNWRMREVINYEHDLRFLDSYRWSSHLDYAGIKNFPSVTQRDYLSNFFGGSEAYRKDFSKWIKEISLEDLKDIILE